MFGSWHLGKLADIDIRIHWTFLLLPAWIYFSSMAAGMGIGAATMAVLFVLSILIACPSEDQEIALELRAVASESIASRDSGNFIAIPVTSFKETSVLLVMLLLVAEEETEAEVSSIRSLPMTKGVALVGGERLPLRVLLLLAAPFDLDTDVP